MGRAGRGRRAHHFGEHRRGRGRLAARSRRRNHQHAIRLRGSPSPCKRGKGERRWMPLAPPWRGEGGARARGRVRGGERSDLQKTVLEVMKMAAVLERHKIEVRPTGAALGADIDGVDLAKELSDEELDAVKQAWAAH